MYITSYQLEWPSSEKLQTINAGEDVEKREPSYTVAALVVKNRLPGQETQETWVPSLGQEDPPEEEMATHSSTLA